MTMKIRTRYTPHERVRLKCTQESKVKKSEMAACDINNIMRKYEKTGILPVEFKRGGLYGDFSSVPDYQTSLALVARAQEQFERLPAKIRQRFDHDPAKFLQFAGNKNNIGEMIEMGLALRKTPKEAASEAKEAAKAAKEAPKA